MINYKILACLVAIAPISVYYLRFLLRKSKNESLNEVYWTNHLSNKCESDKCNLNYCTMYRNAQLKKLIENAKYSIDLAMHIFTSLELSDAILQAFKRNIRVRIICCNLQHGSTGSQVWNLYDEGIAVRFQKVNGEQLMHHKFCIIDGKNRVSVLRKTSEVGLKNEPNSILMSGSCNWTRQGLYSNWENIVVTSERKLIDSFEKEFELMWNEFRPQK
ncbi:mitochondrial cardiolipin hydrolase [Condylostylus longicornis]|uniref:mitochondrial cardiolipin hydrolase n=1 Tax=Condylostylus longicornis TaxID=2530218 RepID=UPI00244E28FF|nr:mitochondrial cardiolipin hydrolase [Condylostylus longicornis]